MSRELDLGSGHTAHSHALLIDIYLHAKFDLNRRNVFGQTDGRTFEAHFIWSTWRSRPNKTYAVDKIFLSPTNNANKGCSAGYIRPTLHIEFFTVPDISGQAVKWLMVFFPGITPTVWKQKSVITNPILDNNTQQSPINCEINKAQIAP